MAIKRLVESLRQLRPGEGGSADAVRRLPHLAVYPPRAERRDTGDLSARKLQQQLEMLGGVPLLSAAAAVLHKANRVRLRREQRQRLLRAALAAVGEGVADVYARHLRAEHAVPEDEERESALTAAIAVVEELGLGYKHCFQALYRLPDRRLRLAGDEFHETGFRILELLRWEQRLRALRYQKISPKAWREANQVYFAMAGCCDVEAPYPLAWGLEWCRAHGEAPGGARASTSRIYVAIQLFGLADPASWTMALVPTVDALLCEDDAICRLVEDPGGQVPPDHALILADGSGIPLWVRPEAEEPAPSLLLDLRPLRRRLDQVRSEYDARQFIGGQAWRALPGPLSRVPAADAIGGIELLRARLEPRRRGETRQPVFDARHIQLYPGFKEAYRVLRDRARAGSLETEDDRQFRDALAGYSAALAERAEEDSRWRVVNESSGGVLLSTRETRYSNPIRIGQLVAFRCEDEGADAVQIGYVARLHRSRDRKVDVALVRLGRHASHCGIRPPEAAAREERLLPAILLLDPERPARLVLPPRRQFVAGTPVRLRREGRPAPARLHDLELAKREFLVFEISAPWLPVATAPGP